MATLADVRDGDVIIVGAGPAGAATAWLAARFAPRLDIILIDAEAAPRHRPCGEYLSPAGVGMLERCGLAEAVRATGPQAIAAVALRMPGGGTCTPFAPVLGWQPQARHGWGVRRERFDLALQEAAATRCRLLRGRRMRDLERDGAGWRLHLEGGASLRAGLVIGADGRGSLVRRRGGLDQTPPRRRFALVARARGIAHGPTVEMHLGPLGQIGICPLGDGEVNINLLLAPASLGLLRRMPRERLLRAALAATPTLRHRLEAVELGSVMATGSLPQGCTAVVAPGLAVVGDAAGFCDPFTGEGMSLALCEAERLAPSIASGDFRPYTGFFARTVDRRRRIGTALQSVLDRRRASAAAVTLLGRLPVLNRLLLADAAGYRRSA